MARPPYIHISSNRRAVATDIFAIEWANPLSFLIAQHRFGFGFCGPRLYITVQRALRSRKGTCPRQRRRPSQWLLVPVRYGKGLVDIRSRAGLIAFALLPLCIFLALGMPPFALCALPVVEIHFGKLMWLHSWSARLIWLFATFHVTLWSVQLFKDRQEYSGNLAYQIIWQHREFIYGWVVRTHHFETVANIISSFDICRHTFC